MKNDTNFFFALFVEKNSFNPRFLLHADHIIISTFFDYIFKLFLACHVSLKN